MATCSVWHARTVFTGHKRTASKDAFGDLVWDALRETHSTCELALYPDHSDGARAFRRAGDTVTLDSALTFQAQAAVNDVLESGDWLVRA